MMNDSLNGEDDDYLRPGDTSVGDEDVEATVELLGDVVDDSLGILEVSDVRLIRTAYTSFESVKRLCK